MAFERKLAVFMSIIAGVLLGNTGWVAPTAATWGGGWNICACIFLPVVAVLLIIFACILPKDGEY